MSYFYNLYINPNSYTGGCFANEDDNINFIKLIKIFVDKNIHLDINEIDNLVV